MSVLLRIPHFVEAVAKHAADGFAKVTHEQLRDRLTACQECPFRNGLSCSKCGCWTALKAGMRSENCPAHPPRWPNLS